MVKTSIHAGDSFKYEAVYSGFSAADGWSAVLVIVNHDYNFSIDATVSGESYSFVADGAATSQWSPGEYRVAVRVENGLDRLTIETGSISIMPNLFGGGAVERSHVEKVLAAIEATLEGKATNDQQQIMIGGRSIMRLLPQHLLTWRDRYKKELADMKTAEQLGHKPGRAVKVRFK